MKERLQEFIFLKRITVQAFEAKVGLSNGAVGKMGENTRRSTLNKIVSAFPELNINWLLTGEGEMLNHSHSITQHQNGGSGNSQSVTLGHYDVSRFLDELSAQRRITEKAQEQIDRLITLLENK